MIETKADLERKVRELEQALKDKSKFEASAARAEIGGNYTMVPIRNYGGTTVSIEYEYKGMTKSLLLSTEDPKDLGAIPIEVWIELERTSKLVSDGYIARTDIPCSNPNVISDDTAFINDHNEVELVAKLHELTNSHVLLRLLRAIEATGNKTGKYLSAASAIKTRVFEVTETYKKDEETGKLVSLGTGIRLVDEED